MSLRYKGSISFCKKCLSDIKDQFAFVRNVSHVIMWIQYFNNFPKISNSFLRNFFDPSYAWIPLPLRISSPPCYASLRKTMTPVTLSTRCLQPIKYNLIKRTSRPSLNFPQFPAFTMYRQCNLLNIANNCNINISCPPPFY